ncbi:MAG: PSD1 and planctomycete cytochrome C domain-containing protein [Planctomycetes bacterium]|nr:PSD1 and planctomycete cytochrome C domain-containing protein [Planctomycetota bacterium]MCH9727420.1 PSD1 and planctomycete cytochrome C domain-containing protein [Planctomycetota bacterium]MCH9775925.1 PSD1 and planctomycete cytochrome C domain-containing protein [Planctomycetota bacterium]MCH9793183.1 PSD1 and planctomycete cytochrome C domain-containing protein [Planctomycetota bacterium]
MRNLFKRVTTFAITMLMMVQSGIAAEKKSVIDFEKQIRPLLKQHCYDCHSQDEEESGLRLDHGANILKGGDRGPAVIPGKSAESLLFLSLSGQGKIPRMPHDLSPLKKAEISIIQQWIDQGAKIPEAEKTLKVVQKTSDHWAFLPIRQPELPKVKQQKWIRNPVDVFILNHLEQNQLKPSAEADRNTLIRRLSLDLTGLPPSVDEVQKFLTDKRPDAYEQLVDRLMASPHYGERWARHWLDVARYADSNGFTIDGPRSIWKYRDWVIQAINQNMPFDQFVKEQLAGDLLPKPTTDQLIATGFHRNTLINQEGGTNPEQFRVEAVVDRVNTTGAAFLGLTVGCAQCHKHKYDPLTQRDFYQLYAIFNSTADINSAPPTLSLPTAAQETKLTGFKKELTELKKQLAERQKMLEPQFKAWKETIQKRLKKSEKQWSILQTQQAKSVNGATITIQKDHSLLVGGKIPNNDTYIVETANIPSGTTGLRLEVLTHASLPKMGPGWAGNGNFVLDEVTVEVAEQAKADWSKFKPVNLAEATADHSQQKFPASNLVDGDLKTGWAINVKTGEMNVNRRAIIKLKTPLKSDSPLKLRVTLKQTRDSKYNVGRFRLSATTVNPSVLNVDPAIYAILKQPEEKWDAKQKTTVELAFHKSDVQWSDQNQQLTKHNAELNKLNKKIVTTMVMKELPKPRETFILLRGNFLAPGARVSPGVPDVLPPMPSTVKSPTRLDFANWLTSKQQPLTARVTVNRYWQRFFGKGIVETENDFGTQGTAPSNPELLDWLAAEFMNLNWDVKKLHRLIVTSAAYRQSSDFNPTYQEQDPRNLLLSRQNRYRIEAESIRDLFLASSGLLTRKIGGPSVYPPQPEGIYVLTQNKKSWPEEQGENRFRRGMYTYFWRSRPYPMLPTFDAPNSNTTCTRRVRSNTPLQALTLANDQSLFELIQGLAVRILQEGPDYDEGRLRHAFQICLSRTPTDHELGVLTSHLAEQRAHFKKSPKEAEQFASQQLPEKVTATEAASWTAVARVLMNLDEFITRE